MSNIMDGVRTLQIVIKERIWMTVHKPTVVCWLYLIGFRTDVYFWISSIVYEYHTFLQRIWLGFLGEATV